MKVIMKQRQIEVLEAIRVQKSSIGILFESNTLKQEILEENGQLILRSHEIENNDVYNSVLDMDVFLKENDLLIKTESGYTKPIAEFVEINEEEEKAIELINSK